MRPVVYLDELDVIPVSVYLAALAERLEARRQAKTAPAPERAAPAADRPTATAAPASSWLVTVRCLADNVPCGLFDTQAEAEGWAGYVANDPLAHVARYRKLMGMDRDFWTVAAPMSVDVVEFVHCLPDAGYSYLPLPQPKPRRDDPVESRTFYVS